MDLALIKIGLCTPTFLFAFSAKGDKVESRITLGYAKQFPDLFIGSFPLSDPVADMDPASADIVLLRRKKKIAGGNRAVFDPKLATVELDHDDDHDICADDLTPAEALTGGNVTNRLLISHDDKLHRLMSEGSRCRECYLHDLIDHGVINMFIRVSTN